MCGKVLRLLAVAPVALALASCGLKVPPPSKSTTTNSNDSDARRPEAGPRAKPIPPLKLPVPPGQPERIDDRDFKSLEAGVLYSIARSAATKKSYRVATVSQYWYVQKSKEGQYDLACYLAQLGQIDPAFYWLQVAGLEDGVDTEHAKRDEDLESLRRDPRWAEVVRYLQDCSRYFESTPSSVTVVVLPKAYRISTPIPAVIWLHGMGSQPGEFVNNNRQQLADTLNVAFIGVSGTKGRGPRRFVWAQDAELDSQRIRKALAEVADRVTIQKGPIVMFGFSQGAQGGLEVAVRHPDEYAGAIALSPGAKYSLDRAKRLPLLAKRGFVVSCGANEHPGNVQLAQMDADWLRQAKAQLLYKPYPGVAAHSFPDDFEERFPEWVRFILKSQGE